MATSPRAAAPTASSADWNVVRPFGARAIGTTGVTKAGEALFVQTFRVEEGNGHGDPVRDLRALMNLRHTNVARIKEVTQNDGEVTVVSPYVEGETLAALRVGGPIPLGVQLRILVDALAGITAIHGVKDSKLKPLGIVHGEIAPANIVVGLDGVPKIIQLCGVHASPGTHGADTLGYLAPEILLADDAFDQRVDVYAVGVMLWESLSGSMLFPETNPGAIVTRHLSGRIRKATLPGDATWAEPLIEVAQKAISTDPNARYATAAELANEIKRLAKTNLAATAKVAALVKERGAEAIAARRTALGIKAALVGATAPRAPTKPLEAPKPSAALKPVPTPADALPATKPVDASDRENLSASAVLPAVRPPQPDSVHDRITMPTVHDRATVPKIAAAAPVADEESVESADFADIALESEPPPPPVPPQRPGVLAQTEMHLAPPAAAPVAFPEPAVATAAPVAAAEPLFPAPAPLPQIEPFPPAPMFTPRAEPAPGDIAPLATEPAVAPLGDLPTEESIPPDDPNARRKRRTIVFAAVGICGLLLVLGSLRACMKGSKTDEATAPKSSETAAAKAKPVETAAVTPAPETTATTKPAETTTAAETAKPAATVDPPVAKTADPPVAKTADPPVAKTADPPATTKPTATAAPTSTATTKPTATSKTKPKTYDPLGI